MQLQHLVILFCIHSLNGVRHFFVFEIVFRSRAFRIPSDRLAELIIDSCNAISRSPALGKVGFGTLALKIGSLVPSFGHDHLFACDGTLLGVDFFGTLLLHLVHIG